MFNKEDVKADTSLYPHGSLKRAAALLKCYEADAAGNNVQWRPSRGEEWKDGGNGGRPSWAYYEHAGDQGGDYRIKPKPVVTTEYRWYLSVPGLDGGTGFPIFSTREAALKEAAWFVGDVLVQQVEVTYEDGKETRRKLAHDLKGVRL